MLLETLSFACLAVVARVRNELGVDVDACDVVDDDADLDAVAILQQVLEGGGLAGAEESRQQGDGDGSLFFFLGGGLGGGEEAAGSGRAQAKGGRGSGTVVLVQPAGACRHRRETSGTGARDGEGGDPGGRRQQNKRHWQLHLGGAENKMNGAFVSVRLASFVCVFRHANMTQDTATAPFSFLAYHMLALVGTT